MLVVYEETSDQELEFLHGVLTIADGGDGMAVAAMDGAEDEAMFISLMTWDEEHKRWVYIFD